MKVETWKVCIPVISCVNLSTLWTSCFEIQCLQVECLLGSDQHTLTLKRPQLIISWECGTKIADYNHRNYNYLFVYTVICLVQLFFANTDFSPNNLEVTIHFMHILHRGVSRVCTNCWYSLYNPFWNRKQYLVCHTTELSVFLSTRIEVTLNNQRHQLQFLHILH